MHLPPSCPKSIPKTILNPLPRDVVEQASIQVTVCESAEGSRAQIYLIRLTPNAAVNDCYPDGLATPCYVYLVAADGVSICVPPGSSSREVIVDMIWDGCDHLTIITPPATCSQASVIPGRHSFKDIVLAGRDGCYQRC